MSTRNEDKVDHQPVWVEDPLAMKGSYLRNLRTDEVVKIVSTGTKGVTCFQATEFLGDTFGPEIFITWRAVRHIYAFMVHASEIDAKGAEQ